MYTTAKTDNQQYQCEKERPKRLDMQQKNEKQNRQTDQTAPKITIKGNIFLHLPRKKKG